MLKIFLGDFFSLNWIEYFFYINFFTLPLINDVLYKGYHKLIPSKRRNPELGYTWIHKHIILETVSFLISINISGNNGLRFNKSCFILFFSFLYFKIRFRLLSLKNWFCTILILSLQLGLKVNTLIYRLQVISQAKF